MAIFLLVTAALLAFLGVRAVFRTERDTPPICPSCKKSPLKPGQAECGDCWDTRQI